MFSIQGNLFWEKKHVVRTYLCILSGFSMIADSADGKSRLILEKESFGGVFSENKIDIPKPNDIEERLIRVKKMTEDGKTQKEISKFTMTSQKTVSNDIKKLKERGTLKKQNKSIHCSAATAPRALGDA